MQELYIIRHGLAGKRIEDGAEDDERPLTKKGRDRLKEIAKSLKARGIAFDKVLTSPLLRAKQSAEILNNYCSDNKEITVTELLKPDASYENFIKFLNKLKSLKKVAIVGHEPFLSGFASYCLTKNKSSFLNIKKGGILMLEINEVITPGSCLLSWLLEPNHIIQEFE